MRQLRSDFPKQNRKVGTRGNQEQMADLTTIFKRIDQGDAGAFDDLLPIVYDELRQLASRQMARESAGHTLQTTALVHEAYLRLVGNDQHWDGRGHFFTAAAEAMRRILVERARSKARLKRGGHRKRRELGSDLPSGGPEPEEVVRVNDLLDSLPLNIQKSRRFSSFTISPDSTSAKQGEPSVSPAVRPIATGFLHERGCARN